MKSNGLLKLIVNSEILAGNQSPKEIFSDKERMSDHEKILQHYFVSKRLRNHAPSSIEQVEYVLRKFFDDCNKMCWEITVEDVNEFHFINYLLTLG